MLTRYKYDRNFYNQQIGRGMLQTHHLTTWKVQLKAHRDTWIHTTQLWQTIHPLTTWCCSCQFSQPFPPKTTRLRNATNKNSPNRSQSIHILPGHIFAGAISSSLHNVVGSATLLLNPNPHPASHPDQTTCGWPLWCSQPFVLGFNKTQDMKGTKTS